MKSAKMLPTNLYPQISVQCFVSKSNNIKLSNELFLTLSMGTFQMLTSALGPGICEFVHKPFKNHFSALYSGVTQNLRNVILFFYFMGVLFLPLLFLIFPK